MANEAPVSSKVTPVERVPPHSEDAERGVLGAVLLDADKVMDLCIEKQLEPESFYIPAHRAIFEVMAAMSREGRPLDLLTVGERLKNTGWLDRIGGPTALHRIVDATPTSAHAEYYINIVRDRHLLRKIIETARGAERNCFDPTVEANEVLNHVEQAFFDITANQHGRMRSWEDMVNEIIGTFDNKHKGFLGVPTGFKDLDHTIKGMKSGNMIVLAARPSMGKTSLAMNVAEHVALGKGDAECRPRPVGVFSLEMSSLDLVKRMICCKAGVSGHDISDGFISQTNHGHLIGAANLLSHAPIFIDDSAGLDIVELRARARRMRSKHNVELIVIDYLQLLRAPEYSRHGRQVEITMVSAGIKGMAKELGIPVLVLSQLSRAPEARGNEEKPKLSDLRDSGSIEQDADIVMMLRRPCRTASDPERDNRTLAIVEIVKNRNGPAMLEIRMEFEESFTRFRDAVGHGVDEASVQPAYLHQETR
ncbi:MAG: replicative DNA helicase [bacterium]